MTEAEKKKAAREILAHYRKYQKDQDPERMLKIQRIVDSIGDCFVLKIENPPAQVTFRPKLFNTEDDFEKRILSGDLAPKEKEV